MSDTRAVVPMCYARLMDAGTDNACWVMCAKDDHGAMAMYLSPNAHPRLELCHCDLSGDIHVVEDGKCCEACQEPRDAFNPENVRKALKYLAERPPSPPSQELIGKLRNGLGIDRTTGKPTTDGKLVLLSAGGASQLPALMWMRSMRDMRATMIEAADALEGKKS